MKPLKDEFYKIKNELYDLCEKMPYPILIIDSNREALFINH